MSHDPLPATALQSRLDELCERHGAALLGLARVLVADERDAEQVTAQALLDACSPTGRSVPVGRRELARYVYVLCDRHGPGPRLRAGAERSAIALARLGGHTYREVAALMNIAPSEAAALIRTGLHVEAAAAAG